MGLLLTAKFSARAYTAKDANTVFTAFNSNFYVVSGTNGWFKDTQAGGITYFWGQAEEIECIIDAYEWSSNAVPQGMITNLLNGFLKNNGSSWTYNMYNDDIMWAVMAFARGGADTGKTNYCNIAKANFDATYARAWDTKLGGGLYWTTDNQSKNACVNGPGAIAASLLYQIYGDINYLNKATAIYNWERAVLCNTNSGAIYDNIGTNGTIGTWASTYNQGTFLGAANFLGQTNDAKLAANFTMTSLTGGGILPEYGIAGNNSGFNAIFLRWMTRFMKSRNLQSAYEPWLQRNAIAAWNVRRTNDNLSWCQWTQPSPAGTNFYSWDCISSLEVLQAADPTQNIFPQATPVDYTGCWPLDATNGTVAADASGRGNNGMVTNASWSSNGHLHGSLVFNGVNNSVQISNTLAGDFSLAFWVKTTQVMGSGQWYNGTGLVDGDTPLNNNDFGTGLVGGKFAFGVGNPDTTILSTSAINDGNWHHCVATRQQTTGSLSVYVDGRLQTTGTGNKNALSASTRLLFGAYASGGGYFNGMLDDVKIFGRTLGSNEVAGLYYNSTVTAATPTNLTATAGNGNIQLSWWEVSAVNSYNLKRSLVSGGPYTTITNVTATTFTDTNVLNNRTYYYVVSAVNALGEGTNSAQASASPAGLQAWFKADSITGLANGAAVSIWTDASGNGWNALQMINANQPTYATGAINGLPVVRFSASASKYMWFYRPVRDDFTIILVFQSSTGIGTGTDFYSGAGLVNGEVSGSVADFGLSLNASGQILAGTGNPDTSLHSSTGFNDGHPHVVTFKRIKSSGLIYLYVDGTQVGAAIASTQSLTSPNQLVLGAQQPLNNFFNGDIAEVLIYNTPLLDPDRLGIERALKCKYAMVGGLVPISPTALTGAATNRRIALNWVLTPGAQSYNLWRSTNNGLTFQMVATGLTNSSYLDTSAVNGLTNIYKVAGVDGCGSGGNSLTAAVLLPQPALGLNVQSQSLAVTWPGWAGDWSLYNTTNLASPTVWLPVTNQVGSNNGSFNVTLPMGSGAQFFRLISP